MAMSENTKAVFNYLKENDGTDMTMQDIADAFGTTARSVNGSLVSFQKKGLVTREDAEIEVVGEDGKTTHKAIKFIRLTDEGRAYDPEVAEAEELARKEAEKAAKKAAKEASKAE